MTYDEIRPLIKRDESFRPFRVTLKDGRTFEIKDPWLVLASAERFIIGVPMPENPTSGIADHFEKVAWSRVATVEMMAPAASA